MVTVKSFTSTTNLGINHFVERMYLKHNVTQVLFSTCYNKNGILYSAMVTYLEDNNEVQG